MCLMPDEQLKHRARLEMYIRGETVADPTRLVYGIRDLQAQSARKPINCWRDHIQSDSAPVINGAVDLSSPKPLTLRQPLLDQHRLAKLE
jgi:hypothetical protein